MFEVKKQKIKKPPKIIHADYNRFTVRLRGGYEKRALSFFFHDIGSIIRFSGKFQPLLCNGCSHFKTASEITRPKNVEARARTRLINNLVDRRFNCDNIGYYLDIFRK